MCKANKHFFSISLLMQRLLAFDHRLQTTFPPQIRLECAAIQDVPKLKIEEKLKAVVNQIIDSAGATIQDIPKIEENLKAAINQIVDSAGAIIQDIPKLKIEEKLKAVVNQIVDSAGATIQDIPKIEENLKAAVNQIVDGAGAIIQDIPKLKIEEKLKAAVNQIIDSAGAIIKTLQNIDPKEFQDRLESELFRVKEELQKEISEPLPKDKTERYKRQETIITQAIEKMEDAVVKVCSKWKIPEDTVRADFGKIKPHLNHSLLIIGKQRRRVFLLSRELTKDD